MKNILFLLSALLFLSACQKLDDPLPQRKRAEYPDLNYREKLEIIQNDKGLMHWKLNAMELQRWSNKGNLTTLRNVSVELYDSLGKISAWIHADSGILRNDGNAVTAYGRVRARSPNHMEVSTDTLLIQRNFNSVTTDAPVRILTPEGDLLTGTGFQSDLHLTNWHVRKEIKAIFQNLADRVEEQDKKSSLAVSSSAVQPIQTAKAKPNPPPPLANSRSVLKPFGPLKPGNAPSRHPKMDDPDSEK